MLKTDANRNPILDCIKEQHDIIEKQNELIESLMSLVKTMLSEQRDLARSAVAISLSNADPEPHGSRDTFVPKPKPMTQEKFFERARQKEDDENAVEEYNAMQD